MRRPKWLWQEGKCWWCKQPMLETFGDAGLHATIEHLKPVFEGGGNNWDNIRLAHASCNLERHNLPPDPNSNRQRRKAAKNAEEENREPTHQS